ncbi:aspartate/glutamate racemase family protein [Sulfitobacter geojensis]|uniref:aspartate/glutamate racemase family protein n=1 Tax=Sulfitobacter geojensis TaxID=1342299 RepID=UPI0036DF6A88
MTDDTQTNSRESDTTTLRTLGVIGGMSWESTALYYADINRGVSERAGGLHSATLLIASVDFQHIVDHQLNDRWDDAGRELADIARRLEDAGAEAIALAVNTMHKVADPIRDAISVPFLDIRTCMADAIASTGSKRALLLGTDYVVKEDYYSGELSRSLEGRVSLSVLSSNEQHFVHDIIYDELSKGSVLEETRHRIASAIQNRIDTDDISAVALACTELPMLRLKELLPDMPIADSTSVHVNACVDFILRDDT